ncbi:MAG: acyltransferase [Deltaproteobacteria bacterium]|nr:acyltransferase [Deltaproteobacteria bacterium]
MKPILLKWAGLPLIVIIRIMRPMIECWRRFYFTARLKADVKNMDFSVHCDGPVHVTGTRHICIGKQCRLGMDTELRTMEKGKIHLGHHIRIDRGCTFVSYSEISIQDYAIIGEFVSIRDANHGMSRRGPMRFQPRISKPIRIERDVWIGRGACILPGVTIGEGTVIGPNSVVKHSIPPYSVAAGIPAKIIKQRGEGDHTKNPGRQFP